jgi:hypothetical protein
MWKYSYYLQSLYTNAFIKYWCNAFLENVNIMSKEADISIQGTYCCDILRINRM